MHGFSDDPNGQQRRQQQVGSITTKARHSTREYAYSAQESVLRDEQSISSARALKTLQKNAAMQAGTAGSMGHMYADAAATAVRCDSARFKAPEQEQCGFLCTARASAFRMSQYPSLLCCVPLMCCIPNIKRASRRPFILPAYSTSIAPFPPPPIPPIVFQLGRREEEKDNIDGADKTTDAFHTHMQSERCRTCIVAYVLDVAPFGLTLGTGTLDNLYYDHVLPAVFKKMKITDNKDRKMYEHDSKYIKSLSQRVSTVQNNFISRVVAIVISTYGIPVRFSCFGDCCAALGPVAAATLHSQRFQGCILPRAEGPGDGSRCARSSAER